MPEAAEVQAARAPAYAVAERPASPSRTTRPFGPGAATG